MEVTTKYFPRIMEDNDVIFLNLVKSVISSVDELACLEITNGLESYGFRIAPSHPKYITLLIEEILQFINLFKFKLEMSKSMKTSATIEFKINTN